MTPKRAAALVPPAGIRDLSTFAANLTAFQKWMMSLKLPATRLIYKPAKVVKGKLTGQSYLFTGVRDKGLEAAIKEQGGAIASSVGKATVLVVADLNPAKPSDKFKTAKSKGIKIVHVDTLRNQLL